MIVQLKVTARVPAGVDQMVRAIRAKLAEVGDVEDVQITYEGRRAPVQGDRGVAPAGTVAWEVHEQAWSNYAAHGHGQQSAERMAERGGFGYREFQCALAGHYDRVGCGEVHPVPPTWEPRMVQR